MPPGYLSAARISIILHARNCPVAFWEGDFSLSKVYEGPLGYVEGSPLTLRNHFIQPYRALDTLLRILLTLDGIYYTIG